MTLFSEIRQSKSIFLDTAPLIYFIEAHKLYGDLVKKIVSCCAEESIEIFSSAITLHEVLVMPYRDNNIDLIRKFSNFLRYSGNINLYAISEDISQEAAKLRSKYLHLKLADSLQISAALTAGANIFMTNDKQLKNVTEIRVFSLDDWLGVF